jgi:hypothetical protein
MDYKERKIKGVIREAFFAGMEVGVALGQAKKSGNPYTVLNFMEDKSLQEKANQVVDTAYTNSFNLFNKGN